MLRLLEMESSRLLECFVSSYLLSISKSDLQRLGCQQISRNHLEMMYLEHDKVTLLLKAQKDELKQQEEELELQESQNEGKRAKLKHNKKMIERTFLEQKKAEDNFLRLAEEQKREEEKLYRKIIELERKLDEKQSLEPEIERMRGALQVMKHMKDDEDADLKQKMKEIEESLKEKEDEMEYNEQLNQSIIVKERKTNGELQDARKELIKREEEKLYRKIIELERKLDDKQSLEPEIERMRGALQVMKHMEDDEDADLKQKMKEIEESSKEKEEEMEYNEQLNQSLIVKERKTNDELQDARKEMIKTLKGKTSRSQIWIKRMGELDVKPFHIATKRKYAGKEASEKVTMLCFGWEEHLKNPVWYPFKGITDEEHRKAIIDKEDEKLKALRDEYGDEVFKAVSKALIELIEYNGSGKYTMPELWHSRDNRKASLKEGVVFLLKQRKPQKKKN